MTKLKLELDEESEYLVIGISTHQKDFRLAWGINRALQCNLAREHDYRLTMAKGKVSEHALFRWDEPEGHFSYLVAANRGSEGFLIPEYKSADYLFVVSGMIDQIEPDDIATALRSITFVLASFEIPIATLRSAQNLVFE